MYILMNQDAKPKPRGRTVKLKGYGESEPDITTTGVGRGYTGYRIFYYFKEDSFRYIGRDYSSRDPSDSELKQFKADLAKAAGTNANVVQCLGKYPKLRLDEPLVEGPAEQTTDSKGGQ
jgi:hypothetical protein